MNNMAVVWLACAAIAFYCATVLLVDWWVRRLPKRCEVHDCVVLVCYWEPERNDGFYRGQAKVACRKCGLVKLVTCVRLPNGTVTTIGANR